jgi:hypothetical protein
MIASYQLDIDGRAQDVDTSVQSPLQYWQMTRDLDRSAASEAGYDGLCSWVSSQSNIRFSVRRPGSATVDEGSWA